MKVLVVNDYATPTGGAEIQLLLLRDELRKRGYDARFFASCARSGKAESQADYECFGTTSRFRTLLQTANPWAYWRLRKVLAEFQPDVVHIGVFLTQLSPLILPLLRHTPSLYNVHWYRPICPLGTKMFSDGSNCKTPAGTVCYRKRCLPLHDWIPLMLQMKFWRRWRHVFDVIVANSEAVKRRLVSEGIEPVEVIHNGVVTRPPRPSLSPPPTATFAGRLVREKGVDVLLRAFTKVVTSIPDARLFLAGEGPERENLQRMIAELGLLSNVTLLGHLSHIDLERYFSAAWTQVVPSRWEEPFGVVATEAMMRGTAVVASNCGGLKEIVQHGRTGFLVPPDDANALADALLKFMQDHDLAERMGEAGRRVALTQFGVGIYVDRFVRLYQTLCSNRKDINVNC